MQVRIEFTFQADGDILRWLKNGVLVQGKDKGKPLERLHFTFADGDDFQAVE